MCSQFVRVFLLAEGADPVKARPYRYPQSQKKEIEKMVGDMLQEGIIVPNTSPFSSPIILVKKKGGTWRFCTNYWALNAITLKDSFPIPTVDELNSVALRKKSEIGHEILQSFSYYPMCGSNCLQAFATLNCSNSFYFSCIIVETMPRCSSTIIYPTFSDY